MEYNTHSSVYVVCIHLHSCHWVFVCWSESKSLIKFHRDAQQRKFFWIHITNDYYTTQDSLCNIVSVSLPLFQLWWWCVVSFISLVTSGIEQSGRSDQDVEMWNVFTHLQFKKYISNSDLLSKFKSKITLSVNTQTSRQHTFIDIICKLKIWMSDDPLLPPLRKQHFLRTHLLCSWE